MRLVLNLVVASLLASTIVLVGYGYLSLQVHRVSLAEDMQRDHKAMVGMLAEAVEEVYAAHGEAAARQLVDEINRRRDNVHLTWLDVPELISEGVAHEIDDVEPSLRTSATVVVGGQPVGGLLLVESMADAERVLAQRRVRITVAAVLMIFVGTVAGAGVGVVLVGRRIRALVAHARRVADGDLDGRIEVFSARDELAELGRELNAMTLKLADARSRVREEGEARVRAVEQLRHAERLMTVGKLAAGMAHELGTPLNVVGESARMIARGETDADTTIEYAGIIAEQADRMTRILRQLMDFARRRPPHRHVADLVDVATLAVELIGPLAERKRVRLELAAARPCRAEIDPDQIQQVLANLLVNAIHAAPESSTVTVSVTEGEPTSVDREYDGPHACVEVRDEGPGIPTELVESVFEPFFTTKDVGEGTGLGLSVAYGLTEEHGGWIEVDSVVGRGTSFRVWLPLQVQDGAPGPEATSGPSAS